MDIKFKNQSIELVGINPHTNQFYLTQQAQQFLMSIHRPIAIITIAGLYRTGKSFLINKLIKDNTHGFRVGSTVNSVTKGLFIWGKPITIQTQSGEIDYLLIDSQGIGSCEQGIKYDTNLLILIFLISSTVVYNSVGAIDEQSLDQLQVVLSLKNCIQKQKQPKPKFVWILRDFSLQLIDKNGNQMTSKQYLETFLEQTCNKTVEGKRKNQIRRAIKENLGERSCYTLVRPTLKEEDLANLNKCKIRTQFIGQIEELKDQLFSGNPQDIKSINRQALNGRLFCKTLQHYIGIINKDQLPSVLDVWEEVLKQNNNQILEQCCQRLRSQVKLLTFPMSRDQLKWKLNELENKIYHQLQSKITAGDEFKIYHKQFIKEVQEINQTIKAKNEEHLTKRTMNDLRQFAKENVHYDKIKPTNLSEFKNILERMRVKAGSDQQAIDYIFQTVIQVNFVVEKKATALEQQLNESKLILSSQTNEKKHDDLLLINMKRQYHDALKTIAKLQENQADTGKDYLVLKTKNQNYQEKIKKLEEEALNHEQHYTQRIEEMQNKFKSKIEEYTENIKKLRVENKQLNEDLSDVHEKIINEESNNRKEVIFQEKIENAWEKFNEEKKQMMEELNSYKVQQKKLKKLYEDLMRKYKGQCEVRETEREENAQKQAQFESQLKNLKKCISDTRESYALTYQTMKTNEKVFKNIENSQKKYVTKEIQKPKQSLFYEEYQSNQQELKRAKQQMEYQHSSHQRKIATLQLKLEKEQINSGKLKDEAEEYRKKCMKLQSQISEANSKFNECLKQIEIAKEKQRSLYEESIVRLLTNLERRDSSHLK